VSRRGHQAHDAEHGGGIALAAVVVGLLRLKLKFAVLLVAPLAPTRNRAISLA